MGLLKFVALMMIVLVACPAPWTARAQLSTKFYDDSCPDLQNTVSLGLQTAMYRDSRIGASLLRMHFHDCFVQGCDGSILLNDTATFTGEQNALPNQNSLRGYNVVEDIKSLVEYICPATVSCADLLAVIAHEAVVLAGGPSWSVEYGRRDSTTACLSCANSDIPAPTFGVDQLTSSFTKKGLDQTDMVTLSGAHTLGKAHCGVFSGRLANFSGTTSPDPTLDPTYAATLQKECPKDVSSTVVVDLDPATDLVFDNNYYTNLVTDQGLMTSDQTLESEGGATASTVSEYASSQNSFFSQFPLSILKMGEIGILTGSQGEIRLKCSVVNS